jgi:hypothetical protein
MATETYLVYRLKKQPHYELILKKGAPFPSETKEGDWELRRELADHQVRDEARDDIESKGYSLARWDVKFTELVGNPPMPTK